MIWKYSTETQYSIPNRPTTQNRKLVLLNKIECKLVWNCLFVWNSVWTFKLPGNVKHAKKKSSKVSILEKKTHTYIHAQRFTPIFRVDTYSFIGWAVRHEWYLLWIIIVRIINGIAHTVNISTTSKWLSTDWRTASLMFVFQFSYEYRRMQSRCVLSAFILCIHWENLLETSHCLQIFVSILCDANAHRKVILHAISTFHNSFFALLNIIYSSCSVCLRLIIFMTDFQIATDMFHYCYLVLFIALRMLWIFCWFVWNAFSICVFEIFL